MNAHAPSRMCAHAHVRETTQADRRCQTRPMCRNITELRGLEPPATEDEIQAAARQYIRKVSGIRHPNPATIEAFEAAVDAVAAATSELLTRVPARRRPPPTVPPLRRPGIARL